MAEESTDGMIDGLQNMQSLLVRLQQELDTTSKSTKGLTESTQRYKDAVESLKAIEARAGKYSAEATAQMEAVKKSYDAMGRATEGVRRSTEETIKATKAHGGLERALNNNEKAYLKYSNIIKGASSGMKKWTGLLGGSTLTIGGARDALVKYNQSMYDLQRIYQVSSVSGANLEKTLEKISSTTTISKNQFLDFAKSMNQGWAGLAPGIDVVGGLASAFNNKLGPGLEGTEKGLKATLSLMEKFPALAKSTTNAILALEKGGDGSEEQAKKQKALLSLMYSSGKIDKETYMTKMKLLSGVTAEQDKQINTNKNMASVAQKSADMQLKLGQQLEPALNALTKVLEKMLELFGKMPLQIVAIASAFKMMDQTMMSGMGRGGMGQFANSASKALKMAKMAKVGAVASGGASGAVGKGAMALLGGGVTKGGLGKTAGLMKHGAKLGAGTGILTGAFAGYGEYQERKAQGEGTGRALGGAGIKGLGAGGGALAGAAIGSAVPVIGTAIGAIVGGLAGGLLGEVVSDAALPELKKAEDKAEDIKEQFEESAGAAEKLALSLLEMQKNYDQIHTTAMETYNILQDEINLMKEMGMIDTNNSVQYFEGTIEALREANAAAKSYFSQMASGNGALGMLQQTGLDLGPEVENMMKEASVDPKEFIKSGGFASLRKSLQDELNKLDEATITTKKTLSTSDEGSEAQIKAEKELHDITARRAVLGQTLNDLATNRQRILKGEIQVVDKIRESWNAAAEGARNMNSVYEERLNTERDLMESAQFGMGASLDMMQKQVDMAYELIRVEKERQNMADVRVRKALEERDIRGGIADSLLHELKTAKSHMQVQGIMRKYQVDEESTQRLLVGYAQDQQDASNKQMQQQKKIYDLTKDIREGYLDALREMSAGFGEFESIIGTQEMGASQLMGAVDAYNASGEQGMLNTMALGGRQSKDMTAAGVGGSYMGQYQAVPGMPTVSFQNTDTYQKGLQRYSGYDESAQEYHDPSKRSSVGGASAMTEGYEGAIREGGDKFDQTYFKNTENATLNALLEYDKRTHNGSGVGFNGGSNQDIMGGIHGFSKPGGGGPPAANRERLNPDMAWRFGASVANGAQGSGPADPSPFTRTDGTMPVSSVSANRVGQEYLAGLKKSMEANGEVVTNQKALASLSDKEQQLLRKKYLEQKREYEALSHGVVSNYPVPGSARGQNPDEPFMASPDRNGPNYRSNPLLNNRLLDFNRVNINKEDKRHASSGTTYFGADLQYRNTGWSTNQHFKKKQEEPKAPSALEKRNMALGDSEAMLTESVDAIGTKIAFNLKRGAKMNLDDLNKEIEQFEAHIASGRGTWSDKMGESGTRIDLLRRKKELESKKVEADENYDKAVEKRSSSAKSPLGKQLASLEHSLEKMTESATKSGKERSDVAQQLKDMKKKGNEQAYVDLEAKHEEMSASVKKEMSDINEKRAEVESVRERHDQEQDFRREDARIAKESMTFEEVQSEANEKAIEYNKASSVQSQYKEREIEEREALKKSLMESGTINGGKIDEGMAEVIADFASGTEEELNEKLHRITKAGKTLDDSSRARAQGYVKKRDSIRESASKHLASNEGILGGKNSGEEAALGYLQEHYDIDQDQAKRVQEAYTEAGSRGAELTLGAIQTERDENEVNPEHDKLMAQAKEEHDKYLANKPKSREEKRKDYEAERQKSIAQNMRQSLGEKSEGLSQEEIHQKLTKQFVSGGNALWEMPDEERKKIKDRIKEASEMEYKNKDQLNAKWTEGVASKGYGVDGYTSADGEKGFESSKEVQAHFNSASNQQQMADTYGVSGEGGLAIGGGGSNGSVVVRIALDDDLKGQIASAVGVTAELVRNA